MVAGSARLILGLAVTFLVVLAVQGCRQEEPNRPLLYHKGSYSGQTEPPLSEQQLERLRQRAQYQQF
jgi:hypothetical protein